MTLENLHGNLMKRIAVLVIDMQHDFLDDDAPILCPGGKAIISNLINLLEFAREAGIPIIYTQESHRASKVDFGRELDYGETLHCLEGSRGVEIIPQLRPRIDDHIVVKRRYSGFLGTDLDLLLKGLGVSTVVITGVATDVCVRATAQDAMQLDYSVLVPRECVAGTTSVRHDAALENISYVFGKVVPLSDVLERFCGMPGRSK